MHSIQNKSLVSRHIADPKGHLSRADDTMEGNDAIPMQKSVIAKEAVKTLVASSIVNDFLVTSMQKILAAIIKTEFNNMNIVRNVITAGCSPPSSWSGDRKGDSVIFILIEKSPLKFMYFVAVANAKSLLTNGIGLGKTSQ